MPDKTRRIPAISVFVLVTVMLLGALPAMAAAPEPVIQVPGGEAPVGPSPDEPVSDEPSADEPPADEPPADDGCLIGSAASLAVAGPGASDPSGGGVLAAYPGPVIQVPQQASACQTRVSMSLIVTSPNGQKPEGADATLAELAVSRATLEAGFDVTLPAGSRTIALSDAGEDWELTSVACTCGRGAALSLLAPGRGGVPVGTLASYPQPVIAVSLVSPGSDDCGDGSLANSSPGAAPGADATLGATVPSGVLSMAMPSRAISLSAGSLASYPAPVVQVPPGDRPPAPTRQPGSVSWDQDGRVSIRDSDAAGGIFSCVWTVELVYGELALETKTEPGGREDRFTYRVTPDTAGIGRYPMSMRGVPPANTEKLWNGSWSVELADLDEGWEVERSDCRETDSATASSAAGTTASVGLDPADRVQCTFELKLLAPRPGSWRARNGAAKASCGAISFALPVATDLGRMRVQRDGELLILRGVGSGSSTTWRLERDQQDLLRYRGTVSTTIGGARGTFKTDLRLVSEKRMKGRFSGKAKLRGTSCSFSRPVTLTYAGG